MPGIKTERYSTLVAMYILLLVLSAITVKVFVVLKPNILTSVQSKHELTNRQSKDTKGEKSVPDVSGKSDRRIRMSVVGARPRRRRPRNNRGQLHDT